MKRRHPLFILFVFFAFTFVTMQAFAGPYVLRTGREQDVLALFAPYQLESVVSGDWKLWSVSIEPRKIDIGLRNSNETEEHFTLVHPDDAMTAAKCSESFALVRESKGNPSTDAAVDLLAKAIKKNDAGGFWQAPERDDSNGQHSSSGGPVGAWANVSLSNLELDGIVGLLLLWGLAIVLALRLLKDSPRWMRLALPAVVLLGISLRLGLAPPAMLGPWSWSRLWANVRIVYEGPGLATISSHFGQTFYLTDVMFWTNFAYAAVMPLVLFSHATYLLRDPRAGIAASFAIALLPQHIRFSRCEDAFIPSLVLTSIAFALIHAWLRDSSKIVRTLALVALPFVLYPGYLLRPLNILFIAIYLPAIVLLHPETAPAKRRLIGGAVVAITWLVALPSFATTHETTLQSASSDLSWIANTFVVATTPRLLVLTDPNVTPLVLPILAIAGAVLTFRQGEKRQVVFLTGWMLLFLVMHAFVIQPSMQPRYHLHLVVPFLLLAASAVPFLLKHSRVGLAAAFLSISIAPLLHRHWMGDLHYSEMQEYAFVRSMRDEIPEDCTIIEYVGSDARAIEMRFARIGEQIKSGQRKRRFNVVPLFAPGVSTQGTTTALDVAQNPPACLYVYEGLTCAMEPANDTCGAFRHRLTTHVVKEKSIILNPYDDRTTSTQPPSGSRITLTLLRADPKPAHEAPRAPE